MHASWNCTVTKVSLLSQTSASTRMSDPSSRTEEPLDKEKQKIIKVVQIKLNKSNLAMQEMTRSLRKETNFICMVTEPSVIRHRLSGILRHYNSIPSQLDNSPRAAIFTNPSIPIQVISNLSHRDIAVGHIKCGGKQTAIISAYMVIKAKPITE